MRQQTYTGHACGSAVEPVPCDEKVTGLIPLVCTLHGSHHHPCMYERFGEKCLLNALKVKQEADCIFWWLLGYRK